jgi:hypothetical protein
VELELQLALADAVLGDPRGAAERVDGLIEKYGADRGPTTLSMLHQGRARLALLAGDMPLCRRHTELMGEFARATSSPALISQWKRLDRRTQRADVPTDAASVLGHIGSVTTLPETTGDDFGETELFSDGSPGLRPMMTAANSDAPRSGSVPPPAQS